MIVDSITDYLRKCGHEVLIFYGIGAKSDDGYKFCYRYEQALYRRFAMLTGRRYSFAPLSTARLIHRIKKFHPDVVHLHSINGNCLNIIHLLTWLKENHYPTIITNHAEFFYTGNCTSAYGCSLYRSGCTNCPQLKWATDSALVNKTHREWLKMKNAYSNAHAFYMASVSEYTRVRAEQSPLVRNLKHFTVLNGIDTTLFRPSSSVDMRKELGINNHKKIILFVTSEFSPSKEHLKGGYYLLQLAKSSWGNQYQFVVVGNESTPSCDYDDNVIFAGRITERTTLACYYSQADLVLSLSKAETFGMTCAEAMCCGTPVAGFKSGGPESISIKEYSKFVEYGDLDGLQHAVDEVLSIGQGKKQDISQRAGKIYALEHMSEQYLNLYNQILKEEV